MMATLDLSAAVPAPREARTGFESMLVTARGPTPTEEHVAALMHAVCCDLPATTGDTSLILKLEDTRVLVWLRCIVHIVAQHPRVKLLWIEAAMADVLPGVTRDWRACDWHAFVGSLLCPHQAVAVMEDAFLAGHTEVAAVAAFRAYSCLARDGRLVDTADRVPTRIACADKELVLWRARGATIASMLTSVRMRLNTVPIAMYVSGERLDVCHTLEAYGVDDETVVEVVFGWLPE